MLHALVFKVLSAEQIQKVAHSVVRDGGVTTPTAKLARMGSYGDHGGNCCRDLARITKQRLDFLEVLRPYRFDVPILNQTTPGVASKPCHVALPHELFSAVYKVAPEKFHRIFETSSVRKFWQDEALHRRIPEHVKTARTIAIRVWGDDAAHCKTNGFEALHWTSCTSFRAPGLLSKMPYGILDKHFNPVQV